MNGWMGHMWNSWGMGWGMWIWLLILIGARSIDRYLYYLNVIPRSSQSLMKDRLEVARFRLARGEITPEEFQTISEALKKSV